MGRRKFTSKFKTKVCLEAIKERHTLKELAQKYELSPQQIRNWKREFLARAEDVFARPSKRDEEQSERDKLLKTIGELKVENDFLKKVLR